MAVLSDRIYLDYAATAPLLPEVRSAMEPWLTVQYGNPSSLHAEGRAARAALDEAREVLSERLGCLFGEITFCSSGTEAANLAILGTALGNEDRQRNHILLGAAEHHCVLHCRERLERYGYRVSLIPVDAQARVRPESLTERVGEDTLLVSVMHANNETGGINGIRQLSDIAHEAGALFHCDAVQTLGALPWTVNSLDADLVSVSAHKIGGPKGVGALAHRAQVSLGPLILGGGQEREMRGGTENVAGIVGFKAAVQALAGRLFGPEARDAFAAGLGVGVVWTTPGFEDVLPGHCHIRLPGVRSETALIALDRAGISASSGAACSSGAVEPSHVLRAMGLSESEANEGLRFTLGPSFGIENARHAGQRVASVLAPLAT